MPHRGLRNHCSRNIVVLNRCISKEGPLEIQVANPELEAGLVREAQKGNRHAFEQLYRQHVRRVYALCLRICADVGLAEELTQDVFVRVWERLRSFRGDSALSSWIHRVAVNVALVHIRTVRKREARVFSTDNLESYDDAEHATPPGTALDLENAIASLPPQARMIFVLHDIEGYRHEEIAELMGLAVGTSKAQLHRARMLLKEVLKK